MNNLNVGIVGLGWVAGAHIDAFRAVTGAGVTAVCSRRTHDDAALSVQFGTPLKSCVDYEEMLSDPDIHVVDICTPHPFHADQAVAAAEAGKHLIIFYSEKLDGLDRSRWSTLETSLIDSGDVQDHPYEPQFQAFVDSVRQGVPMPYTDMQTACESHRVVFAADRSAAEGRPVRLEELE